MPSIRQICRVLPGFKAQASPHRPAPCAAYRISGWPARAGKRPASRRLSRGLWLRRLHPQKIIMLGFGSASVATHHDTSAQFGSYPTHISSLGPENLRYGSLLEVIGLFRSHWHSAAGKSFLLVPSEGRLKSERMLSLRAVLLSKSSKNRELIECWKKNKNPRCVDLLHFSHLFCIVIPLDPSLRNDDFYSHSCTLFMSRPKSGRSCRLGLSCRNQVSLFVTTASSTHTVSALAILSLFPRIMVDTRWSRSSMQM